MCVQIIKAGGHMALSPLQRALKASSWPPIPPMSVDVVVVVVVQVVDQNLTLLSPKLSKTAQSGLTTPADMHFSSTSLLFTIEQFFLIIDLLLLPGQPQSTLTSLSWRSPSWPTKSSWSPPRSSSSSSPPGFRTTSSAGKDRGSLFFLDVGQTRGFRIYDLALFWDGDKMPSHRLYLLEGALT